jgi:hypothetical protein
MPRCDTAAPATRSINRAILRIALRGTHDASGAIIRRIVMATQTLGTPYVAPSPEVRRGVFTGHPIKVSWGGIFAGVVAALGIWVLLYVLGLALGLSAVHPTEASSIKASGIFTGIWSGIVPLIALFFGGFVAARAGGVIERGEGALHGLVVWGAAVLLGVYLLGGAIGTLLSGIGGVGKAALETAGMAGAGTAQKGGEGGKVLGLDADDALKPVNDRLRAQGKPEVTPEQFKAATKDVVGQVARGEKVDRETLVQSITTNTSLERQDVETLADRVQQQLEKVKEKVATTAGKAADATGKVFWAAFIALLLGLIASMIGGLAGATPREEVVVAAR